MALPFIIIITTTATTTAAAATTIAIAHHKYPRTKYILAPFFTKITGKAISALLTNPGDVLDYVEVIGRGHSIKNPAAPFIAIPTTSGTGSEVR